jgi:hypothetical protein
MDYRNNYFTSDDPNKIIEFYNGFKNRNQLIQWMKERPKGVDNIHEVDGDKEIIVVIPTADFNGKYAKECRDNIFKGLHIIFVESGEIPDPYFNGAHNVNVGIKKAMEYNPKWIVFSGDDMYKIDDISYLVDQLGQIQNNSVKNVFVNRGIYHSKPMYLAIPRLNYYLAVNFLSLFSDRWKYRKEILKALKKFNSRTVYYPKINYRILEEGTSYFQNIMLELFDFLCFKKVYNFINMLDFVVLSGVYAKEKGGMVYDETFINEMEDTDLSVSLSIHTYNYKFADFQIGDYIGSSLGNGISRECRVVPGYSYFVEKTCKEYAFIKKASK